MSNQLSISEQLAHSTVRIETKTLNGSGSGTGFFHKFAENSELHVPAIVTNKHVIDGAIEGQFVLTESSAEGEPVIGKYHAFKFLNFQEQWIQHPDPAIDLCAMPIAPIINQAKEKNLQFFYIGLDKTLLLTQEELDDLVLMEEIIMIGYPNGIWDQHNNMPVFRKGITATHPNLNWNGKAEFLIDAACFPGSSGSPVFLFNQSGFSTKSKGMTIGASRVKLLGVLYAGPQHTVSGEIRVIQVPTHNVAIPVSAIPNNLGMVIKASQLEAFEKIFSAMLQK